MVISTSQVQSSNLPPPPARLARPARPPRFVCARGPSPVASGHAQAKKSSRRPHHRRLGQRRRGGDSGGLENLRGPRRARDQRHHLPHGAKSARDFRPPTLLAGDVAPATGRGFFRAATGRLQNRDALLRRLDAGRRGFFQIRPTTAADRGSSDDGDQRLAVAPAFRRAGSDRGVAAAGNLGHSEFGRSGALAGSEK